MRIISKDPAKALRRVGCKSEYVHKYFNCWGESVKAWRTIFVDPGTGRYVSFWGKINVPGVRYLSGVAVYLNPINNAR